MKVVGSYGHLGWASEYSSQFGMTVTIFVVYGVFSINLCNLGGFILIGYFYNKPLLEWMGELLWLFDTFF